MKFIQKTFSSPAFKQSAPTLLVTLINKLGMIGLSLVPILLVERKYSISDSTLVMSWIRGALPIATLLAGWMTDRIGMRTGALLSLLMAGIGLAGIPLSNSISLLILFGVITQCGDGFSRVSFRLLLTKTVDSNYQKEALGWTRVANNMGQVLSFSLGAVASKLGLIPLFFFDAFTSLTAFFIGLKILPHEKKRTRALESTQDVTVAAAISTVTEQQGALYSFKDRLKFQWAPLLGCTFILFLWIFLYELFMSGIAGRLEVLHSGHGLKLFSMMMVVNTVLCTAFSVQASRWLKNPSKVFLSGMLLTALGLLLGFYRTESRWFVFFGMLLVTMGEIALSALASFTQIRLLPESKNSSFIFSLMTLFNMSGRVIAASLVFRWVIHPSSTQPVFLSCVIAVVLTIVLVGIFHKRFTQVTR